MTMGFTKIVAGLAGYYTTTAQEVASDHGGGMAGYYNAPGTPPGRWLGSGLAMYGKHAGQNASKQEVSLLFDGLQHPVTKERMVRVSDKRISEGKAVGGFDLTFTLPKSVNILWASGDEHTRKTIMRAHQEALQDSLTWFEQHAAYSRSGKDGVIKQRVHGVSAVSFTHWDSRDHDPHLHDHVLVSNVVRRQDGHIGTLDGRSLYKSCVAISERHTNLFMDKLTEQLGVTWQRRQDLTSKAVVYEITGVDDNLIDTFSKRKFEVDTKQRELLNRAEKRDIPVTRKVREATKKTAWSTTRKAKPKQPLSLQTLMAKWQRDMLAQGVDPQELVEQCEHVDYALLNVQKIMALPNATATLTGLLDDTLRDHFNEPQPATGILHEQVKAHKTIISEQNIQAEAERLTRGIRVMPGQRDALTDMLVATETARLVPLTPQRYQLTPSMKRDRALSTWQGRAVSDQSDGIIYATGELLEAEQAFINRASMGYQPVNPMDKHQVADAIREASATSRHPLADDQREAANMLLNDPHMIVALHGPAGTGKTTTLNTLVKAYTRLQGENMVLGLAPTAVAAGELRESLGIGTETLAKVLYEARTGHLEATLQATRQAYDQATSIPGRQTLREQCADLLAQQARLRIPEHGVVIVDEAAMCDTISMDHLSRLCAQANAKIIMVGDEYQLRSPGEGNGALTWLIQHKHGVELSSIWRFHDPQEAQHSLLLRQGVKDSSEHYQAIDAYMQSGRIHAMNDADTQDTVTNKLVNDITNHVDSILVVGTNDNLSEMNDSISTMRQRNGEVDGRPEHRMTIADGTTAGRGDFICTRRNSRKLTTSDHNMVRNNDMWVVDRVQEDGALSCHRRMNEHETVTLPKEYVSKDVIGGYALTAFRAQGKTVDHAYTYIPLAGRAMNRSSLYVAMTRGRERNDCYVAVKDIEDMQTEGMPSYELNVWRQVNEHRLQDRGRQHWTQPGAPPDSEHWYTDKDLEPTPRQQAEATLTGIMDESGLPLFAHTWAQNYEANANSVDRLTEQWHYYNRVWAERHMSEHVDEDTIRAWQQDPSYEHLLDTYGQARLNDATGSDRLIEANARRNVKDTTFAFQDMGTTPARQDYDQWLHAHHPTALTDESEPTGVRDAASMMNQTGTLLDDALGEQTTRTASAYPLWAHDLGPAPKAHTSGREQWDDLARRVISWRAQHHEHDTAHALGKQANHPDDRERIRLQHDIATFRAEPRNSTLIPTPSPDSRTPGLQGGKINAIRTGRPILIHAAGDRGDTGGKRYVNLPGEDMPATIRAVRRVDDQATRRLTFRFDTPDQRDQAWRALSAQERSHAQELTPNGHTQPLWQHMVVTQGAAQTQQDMPITMLKPIQHYEATQASPTPPPEQQQFKAAPTPEIEEPTPSPISTPDIGGR